MALKGLDALDTPTVVVKPWWRRALAVGLPPLVALVLFIAVWQIIWASAIIERVQGARADHRLAAFLATVDTGRSCRSCGRRSAGRSSGSRSRW